MKSEVSSVKVFCRIFLRMLLGLISFISPSILGGPLFMGNFPIVKSSLVLMEESI